MKKQTVSTRVAVLHHYPDFENKVLTSLDLREIKLQNSDFGYAHIDETNFSYSDLHGSDFKYASAANTNFTGSNLSGAKFIYTRFCEASFVGANLTNSVWHLSNVDDCNFTDAVGAVAFKKAGSRPINNTLLVVKHDSGLWFKTGCFWGPEKMFKKEVFEKHLLGLHFWEYNWLILKAKMILK